MQTDREYYPKDMAIAIDNIPSSADGTDNPVIGIYYTNPDDNGNPTKVKISGWVNPTGSFPNIFTSSNVRPFIEEVEFLNCNFLSLGTRTFQSCASLSSINLPNSLKTLESEAFGSCRSLSSINLPNGLETIQDNCFVFCASLSSINLPNSLKTLGGFPFRYCSSLKYVTLGDNFNCSNLNLSTSNNYTREIILQWLNALADRTGQKAYTLTIGSTNLNKLTAEDKLIASNKNWLLK